MKRRTPKGWRVVEWDKLLDGRANPRLKIINCPALVSRYAVLVFLHEVGHVVLKHCDDPTIPEYLCEFEAEQWAIKAARAEGITVPHNYSEDARYTIKCLVEKEMDHDPDIDIEDAVLRYIDPDNWKMAA